MRYTDGDPMTLFSDSSQRPTQRHGHWLWQSSLGRATLLFAGRGPFSERSEVYRAVCSDQASGLAWMKQIHSNRFVEAIDGYCGEGDALMTTRSNLTLSVATADCVPLVVAADGRLIVIHAGWRGIASEIVAATLDAVDSQSNAFSACIGPAIGPCCYEVGSDVAAAVVKVSGPDVAVDLGHDKVLLDLRAAVQHQLSGCGVERVFTIECCTRCNPDWLSSYRREGSAAGRNFTFAWLARD